MAEQQDSQSQGMFTHPSQLKNIETQDLASLSKLLMQMEDVLGLLRREFRGEALYSDKDGGQMWIQVTKPLFIKKDKHGIPLKKTIKYGDTEKEIYVVHDEAIDELIMILKFSGINKITPVTTISEAEIIDDLREIECKVAALLCLKQKEWGMDKEMLPIRMAEIKTMIKDARYLAKDGAILKALKTSVSRIEQAIEGGSKSLSDRMRSPFK